MDSASDVSPQVTPPNEASGNGEHQPSEVKLKPLPRVYGKIIIVSSDEVRKRKRKEEKEARREAKKAREAKVGAESSSNGASSSSAKNGEPDEADSTSTTTKNESIPSTIQCHYDGCGAEVKVYRDANPKCALRKAQMRHVQSSHITAEIKCFMEGCTSSCQHLTALYSHISAGHGGVGQLTPEQRETYNGVKKSVIEAARSVINECFPNKTRPGPAGKQEPVVAQKPDGSAIKCLHAGCGVALKVKHDYDSPTAIRKAQMRHLQAKHLGHIPVKCPIDGCASQSGNLSSLGSHISVTHGGVGKLTPEQKKVYDGVKKAVMEATRKLSHDCFPKQKGAGKRKAKAAGRVALCRYPNCGAEVRANRRGKIGDAKRRHVQRTHLSSPVIICPVDGCHRDSRFTELAHIANHISTIHGGIAQLSAEQAAFHESNKKALKRATDELMLECFPYPYRVVAKKMCSQPTLAAQPSTSSSDSTPAEADVEDDVKDDAEDDAKDDADSSLDEGGETSGTQ